MDMNSSSIYHMLDDHNVERNMASLSHTAIFTINHVNSDIFLVFRLNFLYITQSHNQ